MSVLLIVGIAAIVVGLVGAALTLRIVKQYEEGVLFRLGRVVGVKQPGLAVIIPVIDVMRRVSLRIVTMPIQSQGIITRDNVSVDVSAVAYYRVVDATKSVVAIENVASAINQIAQTTLRKVVGQHTLDETLAETDRINVEHPRDPRRRDRGLGRRRHARRAQGHPASREHEARDGPPSRGRTGEAREDHRGRRRGARRRRARRRIRHDDGASARVAAPQSAKPRRDRRRQEHHRRLPGATDEHHRRLGAFLAREAAAADGSAGSPLPDQTPSASCSQPGRHLSPTQFLADSETAIPDAFETVVPEHNGRPPTT